VTLEIDYLVKKGPLPVPIPQLMYPVHILSLQSLKICFNITPPSTPRSSERAFSFVFRKKNCMHFWSVQCRLFLGERPGFTPIRNYGYVRVEQVRVARVNKLMRFFILYTPFTSPNVCAVSRPTCGPLLFFLPFHTEMLFVMS